VFFNSLLYSTSSAREIQKNKHCAAVTGHPCRLESSGCPRHSFFCSFDLATVLVILLGNIEYWLNIFEISVGAHLCVPVLSASEGMVSRLKPLLQQDTMSLE
jgi:hypothetical protein